MCTAGMVLHVRGKPTCSPWLAHAAGIPKGQYKGYTCPQCTRAKVSAQHSRQKEKKKKTGSEKVTNVTSQLGQQPAVEAPGTVSAATKIPILDAKVFQHTCA